MRNVMKGAFAEKTELGKKEDNHFFLTFVV